MTKQAEQQPESMAIFHDGWTTYQKIIAQNYMFHSDIYRDVKAEIERRFGDRPIRVLELGCGDASATAQALRDSRVEFYYGCDLSPVALAVAEKNLALLSCEIELNCTDMLACLSGMDSKFDVVFSSYALHHLAREDKQHFFELTHRLMNADGVHILVDLMREENEDRHSFISSYLGYVASNWHQLDGLELKSVTEHISERDHPESVSDYEAISRASGFIRCGLMNKHNWHHTLFFERA